MRPPFLPPCTPQQINQALLNRGFSPEDSTFLHPSAGVPSSLGDALVSGPPQAAKHGLASTLIGQPITSVPGCDPQLVDVSPGPWTPAFQTAQGTRIELDKPAPATMLPWGEGLDRFIKFADGTGLDTVIFSGGTEAAHHTPNSMHPANQAIDVSARTQGADGAGLQKEALGAGYQYGFYEPDLGHWHFQVGPENILDAEDYNLNKGHIRTVYTQKDTPTKSSGGGE